MKTYLALLRIPNLFIIVLLQSVLYYGILIPAFHENGIVPVFKNYQFPVFVFITLLITGSGYIINDILDFNIDSINKPQKILIGRKISVQKAYHFYGILVTSGCILSLLIAVTIHKPVFILLYIFPVLFLYFYSRSLKKTFIAGNVLVSLFSAGVPAIILIFEYPAIIILKSENYLSYNTIITIFSGLIIFSFFVSLYREVIKDIEDMDGDSIISAKTLPLKYGIESAKAFCGALAIVILILLFYWLKQPVNGTPVKIYTLLTVIIPLFYSVWLLRKAISKSDFHTISSVIKIIMLTGIFMVLFYI
jgi:4-hydroxybenzoate polyprenyltransferase